MLGVRGETGGVGVEGVVAVEMQLLLTLQLMLTQEVGLALPSVCIYITDLVCSAQALRRWFVESLGLWEWGCMSCVLACLLEGFPR